MSNFARGGATRAVAWDSVLEGSVYIIAGADGDLTGTTSGGDTITIAVKAGSMIPLEFNAITSAPTGSLAVW